MKQQASTLKSTIISKLLHSMHSQAIEEAFFHSQDSYIIACQERGPPSFSFFFDILPFFPLPPPLLAPFVPRCRHTRAHNCVSRVPRKGGPQECTPFHLTALIGRKYTCNRQGTDYGPQTNAASNYYNRPPLIIRLFSMSSSAVPRCSLYPPPPTYHYILRPIPLWPGCLLLFASSLPVTKIFRYPVFFLASFFLDSIFRFSLIMRDVKFKLINL